MSQLSDQQKTQEDEYSFPYHYLGVYFERYQRLEQLPYVVKLETVREILGPLEGRRVLDAGCGDGRLCYELQDGGAELVGVDYSEKAIAFARAFNPGAQFQLCDLLELPFEEEFDVVTLVDVIEHMPPEQLPVVIKGLWRAMKPGARLLVSVPTPHTPLIRKHYQHFTAEQLEALFAPVVAAVTSRGFEKHGRPCRHFKRLRNLARLAWPLRGYVPGARCFIRRVESYYRRRVASCAPSDARTIIMVFEKTDADLETRSIARRDLST